MKKVLILLILAVFSASLTFGQSFTETALPNNAVLTQPEASFAGYVPAFCYGTSGLYYSFYSYSTGTTQILHQGTGGVIDTLNTGLPIMVNAMKLDQQGNLWAAGINQGTGPDSLVWKGAATGPLSFVSGSPHAVGSQSNHGVVESVDFFSGKTYLSGYWDSVGAQPVPNLVTSSGGSYAADPNFSALYATGYFTGNAFIAKLSSPTFLTLYSPHQNAAINLSATGYGAVAVHLPLGFPYIDKVWYFQNTMYASATDSATGQQSILKGTNGNLFDTVASLSGGATLRDLDTLGGRLLLVINGTVLNVASGDTFFPVMAYDGTHLVPVVKYLSDTLTGSPALSVIDNGVVHGAFTRIDGISTSNWIRLSAVIDTVAPVVTLIGSDTVYVHRNTQYLDSGATAIDNIDGLTDTPTVYINNVNMAVVGQYQIQYQAVDHAGNVGYSAIRTVFVTPGTGIQDISPDAKIWESERNIMINGINGEANATLYDLNGQVLTEQEFQDQTRIDARSYATGVYLVRVEQQGKSTVQKVAIY